MAGEGTRPVKVLAPWKWTTQSRGDVTLQKPPVGAGDAEGCRAGRGPGPGVRRPSFAFAGVRPWQDLMPPAINFFFFFFFFFFLTSLNEEFKIYTSGR